MKIILVGAKGLLGSNIIPILSNHFSLIPLDIEEWDITDRKAGDYILREYKPDLVVNLAAMTNVDGCEDYQEEAQSVNGEAPGIIAELCNKHSVRFVHFSTDYVFDGDKNTPYTEDDIPNPTSTYGKTKLSGERNVFKNHTSPLVIRTQWLYGKGTQHFISKIIKTAREQGIVTVVDDQRGAPTYAKDIAMPLKILMERGKSGIYHIANQGSCTWYEFAKEIFFYLKIEVQLKSITSLQLNRKAKRPVYSVFDCSKVQRDTNTILRSWQEALHEFLQ